MKEAKAAAAAWHGRYRMGAPGNGPDSRSFLEFPITAFAALVLVSQFVSERECSNRNATLPAGLLTDHDGMTNPTEQEEPASGSHLLGIEAAE